MSDPFLGEIRMFAGTFAPVDWSFCDGSLMSIAQYDALYSLLGTTYGGDGLSTFALPDLRGRVPVHRSASLPLGEPQGVEQVTLASSQMPQHTHRLAASGDPATTAAPEGAVLAATDAATVSAYGSDNPRRQLHPSSITTVGGGMPHDNLQPYLCISFIICMAGIYPTQS